MIGLIGSVIMPHNLYLHSSLVQTREINRKNNKNIKMTLLYFYIETGISLFISFIINLSVISTFAKFYNQEITIENAGIALMGVFGSKGNYIWAIGLLASGQSATCSGTLTGQYVMEVLLTLLINLFMNFLYFRVFLILKLIFGLGLL